MNRQIHMAILVLAKWIDYKQTTIEQFGLFVIRPGYERLTSIAFFK